jgi:hypothetical protein
MTFLRLFRAVALLAAAFLALGSARAQTTVNQAFQTARTAVGPELQTRVVSIYGTGTPAAIQKWYVIFYDPAVPSHGRAVLVINNQINRVYPANGGAVYDARLTFDPTRITGEGPALAAAQGYAARHNIAYDSVHALLKQTSLSRPFRWRVELLGSGQSRGYVFVNAIDDQVASYAPPSATAPSAPAGHADDDDNGGFAHDVKKTFLGIGGDLQEFFTGERTVDK